MTDPIRAALERLVELDSNSITMRSKASGSAWTEAIARARAALSAPKHAEGVIEELALELSKMAEAAVTGARFGDSHFLSRAASVIRNQQAEIKRLKASAHQPAPPAEGDGEWPTDEQLIEAYQRAYRPAWERGEHYGCHIDGLRAAIALDRSRRPAPVPVPVAWGNFQEDGTCVGLSQHPEDIARWLNPRPLFLPAPVPVPVSEWITWRPSLPNWKPSPDHPQLPPRRTPLPRRSPMTDFHAELQALVTAYDKLGKWPQHEHEDALFDAVEHARAALSQPVPPAPVPVSDQELADVFAEGCRDAIKSGEPPFLGGARAVHSRLGHPAPNPPAEGEVGP